MAVDLTKLRTDYGRAGLSETDADPSPIRQLETWTADAIAAEHPDPTAVSLATSGADGMPHARIVLVRGLDASGLTFFTNYESDKGRELAENAKASMCFFWLLLERQARVSGTVEKTTRAESEAYFAGRPRESQLGAWASAQSHVLAGREELDRRLAEVRTRFGEGPVPCPPFWGGYRLVPSVFEFWQGRPSRLHDRLRYTRKGDRAWKIERLSP